MRPHVQITPIGLTFFWCCVALLIAGAVQFSGTMILLGGIGTVALGGLRVLAVRNIMLPGFRLIRDWPRCGFSGDPFTGRTVVEPGDCVRHGLVVEDRMAALESAPLMFARVEGRSAQSVTCRVRGRGIVRSGEVSIRSTFPLGCWAVSSVRCFDESAEMILWPRPLLPAAVVAQLNRAVARDIAEAVATASMAGESLDLQGVREYRSGDAVRTIHWPASSRGQGMMVREYERPLSRPSRFGMIVHSYAPPGEILQPDRFEQSLRLACGLVRWCDERGIELQIDWLIEVPDAPPLTRLALAGRKIVTAGQLEDAVGEAVAACEIVCVVGDRSVEGGTTDDHILWLDPDCTPLSDPNRRQ